MDIATTVVLPASLMTIMFGMGLALRLEDFKRVALQPKAAFVGLFGQLLLLPAVAFGLAWMMQLPMLLAVGLVLVAACPGGATSNIITYLAKGDSALSVSLTAIASFVTVFTIPLVVNLALSTFGGDQAHVQLPFLKTVMQVVSIVLLPVLLGMGLKAWQSEFAASIERPIRLFGILFFVGLVLWLVNRDWAMVKSMAAQVGLICLLLNVSTMLLGNLLARLAKTTVAERVSITIEVGIQNGTLAITIAAISLGNPAFGMPGAFYGVMMFASAALVVLISPTRRNPVSMSENG